ncbi:hypothetical protein PIB30_066425 [Stylosanthes scabra]|uniref:TIR domain-containing protein n=1 Tax=Stylosanthes scabra TaxID=79078 RepID=A0ABU6TM63_9FABA|nr:hypothetical protein [Stylosanthes scabra]
MADDGEASSSLSKGMCDVFLNFRGPDTGKEFTDHLYYRLAKIEKLRVFRDVPGLEPGKEILPSLMDGIKRSWMFIVVMSSDYLSSRSCLEELEEILKYSDNGKKRLIYPIFYHVNPAELRYQKSPESQKAMEVHKRHVGVEKVEVWKKAVLRVSWLSGKHIVKNKEYESEVIGEIAEKVVLPKHQEIKQVLNKFDSEFEAVKSRLKLESRNTFHMVGIYEEDAKIGITTFAFELYNKIKNKHGFQEASFLGDVSKQLWENTANGLENLKKELLSDMGVEESTKQRLQHRRVLVVLEGVDSKEHLKLLLEQQAIRDLFARDNGSRIIITTENKNLFQHSPVMMNGAQLETYCIREGGIIDGNRGSFTMMEEKVVEMEKDYSGKVKNNQLKDEGSPGNVDSMVGMGGLDKTTLAPKVYNNSKGLPSQDNGFSGNVVSMFSMGGRAPMIANSSKGQPLDNANQKGHVNCGSCKRPLMYPTGARSVTCTFCGLVTSIVNGAQPETYCIHEESKFDVNTGSFSVKTTIVGMPGS